MDKYYIYTGIKDIEDAVFLVKDFKSTNMNVNEIFEMAVMYTSMYINIVSEKAKKKKEEKNETKKMD